MLMRLITQFEASNAMLHVDPSSEVASSNGDIHLYGDMGVQYDDGGARRTNLGLSGVSGGVSYGERDVGYKEEEGDHQAAPLAEAYQRMMSDPKFAESIAQTLNQVMSQRQGVQRNSDGNGNDDSMYEQVLESDAMAKLIEQMLPPLSSEEAHAASPHHPPASPAHHMASSYHHLPLQLPMSPGIMEMPSSSQMPIFDFSEPSHAPTALNASAPIPISHRNGYQSSDQNHQNQQLQNQNHQNQARESSPPSKRTRRSPQRNAQQQAQQISQIPFSAPPLQPSAIQQLMTHHVTSPLTPISPLLPSPHPNLSIRTVSASSFNSPATATATTSSSSSSAGGSATTNQHKATASTTTQHKNSATNSSFNNSAATHTRNNHRQPDGKSRHEDASLDAPNAKRRRER
jgi:hypothetical protein